MKSIEVAVLNPEVIPSAEKMMVCAARLTQRGHKIKSLDDFMALYNKSYDRRAYLRYCLTKQRGRSERLA